MIAEHIVLITNLRWVVINDIYLDAHALLIEHALLITPGEGGERARLRGFSTTGTTPIFTIRLGSFEHVLDTGGRDEEIRFGHGLIVKLFRHDTSAPLDVERFEPDEDNEVYENIWNTLKAKVARYWPDQQLVPYPVWKLAVEMKVELTIELDDTVLAELDERLPSSERIKSYLLEVLRDQRDGPAGLEPLGQAILAAEGFD